MARSSSSTAPPRWRAWARGTGAGEEGGRQVSVVVAVETIVLVTVLEAGVRVVVVLAIDGLAVMVFVPVVHFVVVVGPGNTVTSTSVAVEVVAKKTSATLVKWPGEENHTTRGIKGVSDCRRGV